MARSFYECLFLLEPNKVSADRDGSQEKINDIITRHGGEIVDSRYWGDMKLAYPIKKFRKGSYLLAYFEVESRSLPQIEAECRLNDLILRQMVIRLPNQLIEGYKAHFRGETETVDIEGPQETTASKPGE